MKIRWADGLVRIELNEETEAKPLLYWLQRIGMMQEGSVPLLLRLRLTAWFESRYFPQAIAPPIDHAIAKVRTELKSDNWDDYDDS